MEGLEFWKSADYTTRLGAKRKSIISEIKNRSKAVDSNTLLPLSSTTFVEAKLHVQEAKVKIKT